MREHLKDKIKKVEISVTKLKEDVPTVDSDFEDENSQSSIALEEQNLLLDMELNESISPVEKETELIHAVANNQEIDNDQNQTVIFKVTQEEVSKPEHSVEVASKENISSDKVIGYEPNSLFEQLGVTRSYPLVQMPLKRSVIKYPSPGKNKRKGYSEDGFHRVLLPFFKEKIKKKFSLDFDGAQNDYEPDFTFLDKNYNLFVDIEIDEPYSGTTRSPTHYEGSYDLDRDNYFNRNGWLVIRFAEEQIIRYPTECCQYVARVVNSLINGYSYSDILHRGLLKIQKWTFDEAQKMAKESFR